MKIGCNSGNVSCAISINGGWYAPIIDIGLVDNGRSTEVLLFCSTIESRVCSGSGCGEGEISGSGRVGKVAGEADGGERGGPPPKVDINDSTNARDQWILVPVQPRMHTSGATHLTQPWGALLDCGTLEKMNREAQAVY